ncbi:MAG: hypothetical protein ABJN11_09465 [Lentilitoribacter sp.]
MNILKVTIPTSALLVTALISGTAIANNETGATSVEQVITDSAAVPADPLAVMKDTQSYDMASEDGEKSECEDEDEDEGEDDEDGKEKEVGEEEDEDDDGDEYANASCGDESMKS